MLSYAADVTGHSGDPGCQCRQSGRDLTYARATVNGSEIPTQTVNLGFVGVPLEAGPAQHVELRFSPPGAVLGWAISAVALLLTLLLHRRRRVRRAPEALQPGAEKRLV